jgi:hypothetical protein
MKDEGESMLLDNATKGRSNAREHRRRWHQQRLGRAFTRSATITANSSAGAMNLEDFVLPFAPHTQNV